MQDTHKSHVASAAAMLVLAVMFTWWMYGGTVKRYFVLTDLEYYSTTIRHSELRLACKSQLLELIHDVEDRVREGNTPEGWSQTNEAVREMLCCGITEEKASLIQLELRCALRRALNDR